MCPDLCHVLQSKVVELDQSFVYKKDISSFLIALCEVLARRIYMKVLEVYDLTKDIS